jgi:hypothetical protein
VLKAYASPHLAHRVPDDHQNRERAPSRVRHEMKEEEEESEMTIVLWSNC